MSKETLTDGLIMLHPVRWRIIRTLKEKGVPMYIDEIAHAIDEDRRLVSFHLSTLEEKEFLESDFKIIAAPHSKGKAGRFYHLTPKAENVARKLVEVIKL